MTYTEKQIKRAKIAYNAFLRLQTAQDQGCYSMNPNEAERRAEGHNNIVKAILSGDKKQEKEWKLFFCNQEAKKDQKEAESKTKLQANKAASADILAPIKNIKKLGDFSKWLNTSNNPYRKQYFNKKYTTEAVNAYLETI